MYKHLYSHEEMKAILAPFRSKRKFGSIRFWIALLIYEFSIPMAIAGSFMVNLDIRVLQWVTLLGGLVFFDYYSLDIIDIKDCIKHNAQVPKVYDVKIYHFPWKLVIILLIYFVGLGSILTGIPLSKTLWGIMMMAVSVIGMFVTITNR